MKPLLLSLSLAASTVILASSGFAASMLTDTKGMTLYVFDKDTGGKSACYDTCAKNWPPYLVKEGAETGEGWTQEKRKDGSIQWAYDGKPLYFFHLDKKAGDTKGDGMNGAWHTASK